MEDGGDAESVLAGKYAWVDIYDVVHRERRTE